MDNKNEERRKELKDEGKIQEEYRSVENSLTDTDASREVNGWLLSDAPHYLNEGGFNWNPFNKEYNTNRTDYTVGTVRLKFNKDFQRSVTAYDVFSDEECDEIIEWYKYKNESDINLASRWNNIGGEMKPYNGPEDNSERDGAWRKSSTIFMQNYEEGMEWVEEKLDPIIQEANKRFFKFDMPYPSLIEAMQVTHYPTGGVYDWHEDWNGNTNPQQTRKISLSVTLSDPKTYEGGGLEFRLSRPHELNMAPRDRGSVTLFPSFLTHRAAPVISGERYSLIGWCHGNAFK